MPDQNADLKVRPGETSTQYKARIDEKRREMQREATSSVATVPPPVPIVNQPPAVTREQVPPAALPVAASGDTTQVPGGQKPPETGKSEVNDWIKSKGFVRRDGTIDTENMAASLRELERELHRKNYEARANTPPAPPAASVPPVPNSAGFAPLPVSYVPRTAPPRETVETLAKEYDMEPADFDRVARVASTMVDNAMRRVHRDVVAPLENQVRGLTKDLGRQHELLNLMSDPAFKNPQVQFHMHRIMNADPSIIERDPLPWTTAYNRALSAIAREHLGGPSPEPAAPRVPDVAGTPPANLPPMTAGNNGTGAGAPRGSAANQIDPVAFAALPLEEKRAHLKSIGAL
jgi:hypothetical protein